VRKDLAKLNDEEKTRLIAFYKENPALWDSSNPYHKNKEKKEFIKGRLVNLFDDDHTVEHLEKTFHSLRSSMLREVKKNTGSEIPSKKWKFYDEMEFIIADLTKEKKKRTHFQTQK
jgi:Alcohol dehydrogenase transcription factor Myb/SANT-like.